MRPRFGILGIALLCATAPPARAHTTSALAGVVRDPSGGVLPGVTVEASSGAGRPRLTVTRADGSYRLEDLQPGKYRVVFRLGGAGTLVKEGVSVTLQGDTRLDATLAFSAEESIVVTGRRALKDLAAAGEYAQDLVGIADAATEGTVGKRRLEERPAARPADILEAVPGLVISQHSGEGKANQYYLRGFNLDHGTDLASDVAGVPVNMPTHAHGQGYTDLNFLIPELVTSIQFRKGPYHAEEGDFSAAGAVHVNYARSLEQGIAQVEAGSFGYQRALVADSFHLGGGDLLAAGEILRADGPWDHPDGYRRFHGLLGYSGGSARNGFQITAIGYDAKWDSSDQIPRRAVEAGLLPRFGAVDPSDGGRTDRYQLSAQAQASDEGSVTKATAYVVSYGLNLWNDFTYFLNDPVNGDQFEQEDRRVVTGLKASRQWLGRLGGLEMENTLGLQARNDNITSLGLFHDRNRERLSTVRDEHVSQTSLALWAQNAATFTPFLRTIVGLRGDLYRWNVGGEGSVSRGLLSPKLSLVLGPWSKTEVYVNAGFGFHSNDGRSALADSATPLVHAKGAEAGARTALLPGLEATAALWGLDIDSELTFAGDAGETQAGRASRRWGAELNATYAPTKGLLFDADLSLSRARFRDSDPVAGDAIPGALQNVVTAGVTYDGSSGIFGTLRLRYFGPRPLEENGDVRSEASTTVNLRIGYERAGRWRVSLEALNLFDARVSDVDYFYRSRLPGEPADGVSDVHFHPAEPFSVRAAVTARF